jgi:hypothetical protein
VLDPVESDVSEHGTNTSQQVMLPEKEMLTLRAFPFSSIVSGRQFEVRDGPFEVNGGRLRGRVMDE